MPVTSLSFGEEVCNLKLRREVVKSYCLITNGASSEVSVNDNVFGQLMFDRISSNLKGAGTVTV